MKTYAISFSDQEADIFSSEESTFGLRCSELTKSSVLSSSSIGEDSSKPEVRFLYTTGKKVCDTVVPAI